MRGKSGFTLVETIVAVALGAILTLVAYALLSREVTTEKTTAVQALVDSEMARGLQLANSPARMLPYLNLETLGNCLIAERGTGCASFGTWKDLPAPAAPKDPEFATDLDLLGHCRPTAPCLVSRRMRYKWSCTDTACKTLVVEVTVKGSTEAHVKDRGTQISLDRRFLQDRGQLKFHCDPASETIAGIDYAKLTDICTVLGGSDCTMPSQNFTAGGAASDCKTALDASCGPGFATVGLDAASAACVN